MYLNIKKFSSALFDESRIKLEIYNKKKSLGNPQHLQIKPITSK